MTGVDAPRPENPQQIRRQEIHLLPEVRVIVRVPEVVVTRRIRNGSQTECWSRSDRPSFLHLRRFQHAIIVGNAEIFSDSSRRLTPIDRAIASAIDRLFSPCSRITSPILASMCVCCAHLACSVRTSAPASGG